MVKKKILIASVLKPVNEPRMYKKLGLSLAENPNLEVHIAGFKPSLETLDDKISFHPTFDFNRLSFKRFGVGQKLQRLLQTLKPEVLIINTFELLEAAVQYKRYSHCKLIYDIRENHEFNILHLGVYPGTLKHLPAMFVNRIEHRCAPYVDHFLLAEACYKDELDFVGDNYTIVENKFTGKTVTRITNNQSLRLAFTGTVHASTGIFEAIKLFESLKEQIPDISLTITGHAAQAGVIESLQALDQDGLTLNVSKKPINDSVILKAYEHCDILLAPYRISIQNQNKIPTKLYDALANGIPMIISRNRKWQDLTHHLSWICHHDFSNQNLDTLNQFINKKHFTQPQSDATWESEKEKLLALPYF